MILALKLAIDFCDIRNPIDMNAPFTLYPQDLLLDCLSREDKRHVCFTEKQGNYLVKIG